MLAEACVIHQGSVGHEWTTWLNQAMALQSSDRKEVALVALLKPLDRFDSLGGIIN